MIVIAKIEMINLTNLYTMIVFEITSGKPERTYL